MVCPPAVLDGSGRHLTSTIFGSFEALCYSDRAGARGIHEKARVCRFRQELGEIVARIRLGLWKLLLTSRFNFGFRSLLRWHSLQRLRKANNILFICKGNICRSPFAAEYAKRVLPQKEIRSAGYYPASNRPSPSAAIAAASAMGVDLSRWRSFVLTERAMQEADAVIVFDEENYTKVREFSPNSASKIVLLGTLNRGPVFIEDPYGSSEEVFVAIYSRIVQAIDNASRAG